MGLAGLPRCQQLWGMCETDRHREADRCKTEERGAPSGWRRRYGPIGRINIPEAARDNDHLGSLAGE